MSDTYLNLVNSGVTKKIAKQLGIDLAEKLPAALNWGRLLPGHKIGTPEPLFARLDEKPDA